MSIKWAGRLFSLKHLPLIVCTIQSSGCLRQLLHRCNWLECSRFVYMLNCATRHSKDNPRRVLSMGAFVATILSKLYCRGAAQKIVEWCLSQYLFSLLGFHKPIVWIHITVRLAHAFFNLFHSTQLNGAYKLLDTKKKEENRKNYSTEKVGLHNSVVRMHII